MRWSGATGPMEADDQAGCDTGRLRGPCAARRPGHGAMPAGGSPAGIGAPQSAASFSFFSGRTFTFTVAGLAANTCSCLVNGLMPVRFGLAGTWIALILNRPGRVNWPAPFLCTAPSTACSSAASTALTCLVSTLVCWAMWEIRPDLLSESLIGLIAAGAAFGAGLAALAGAFLAVVLVAMGIHRG